jgi:UDP-N-acetylglucosamine acyltransferase
MVRWIADTACVDTNADLADGARIGQFCVIGPYVRLDASVSLGRHTWIGATTHIGPDTDIAEFCVIGARVVPRQNSNVKAVAIRIGQGSRLGRAVVIEPGETSESATTLGDCCMISALAKLESGAILGHDVQLGAGVVIGAQARVGNHVTLGHGTSVRPGVTLGPNCAVGALSEVSNDIPPHMLADGRPATVRGVNVSGLQRLGVEPFGIAAVIEAYRQIYKTGMPLERAEHQLRTASYWTPEVCEFFQHLEASAGNRLGSCREQGRVA